MFSEYYTKDIVEISLLYLINNFSRKKELSEILSQPAEHFNLMHHGEPDSYFFHTVRASLVAELKDYPVKPGTH